MARRNDTRGRMLETAAGLFHTQGYHATGLNQLLSAGDAPRGSLYFHFPGGKEQLAAEAAALSAERLREALRQAIESSDEPGEALTAVVDLLGQALLDSDFRAGCPLSTLALDAAADSEPIRRACAEGYASWCAVIERFLAAHRVAAPAQLAVMILASIEGGLLLAKTQRDLAPLRAVAEQVRRLVDDTSHDTSDDTHDEPREQGTD
jgi:TetR/AcrR family transcriptional repressor of lmrAB and yxaGH operons